MNSTDPAGRLSRALDFAERRQIALYLTALAAAVLVGLPSSRALSHTLEGLIEPVLAALLFATFLQVPFLKLGSSLRDVRFMGTVLAVNFVLAPLVALGLVQFLPSDDALLVGVLLVLLTPCIDYVIVFSGLAGGSADRLLAAAPLLMLLQLLLLPGYLYLFMGPAIANIVEPGPFLHAFIVLILLPLTGAAVIQALAPRLALARLVEQLMNALMVPLMMATLFCVVASQVGTISDRLGSVAATIPIYAAWFPMLAVGGYLAGRLVRLDRPQTIAVVFSGSTRNSLVVLPLALALPETYALAPIVVVTQTMVELVAMVVFVKVIPRLAGLSATPAR